MKESAAPTFASFWAGKRITGYEAACLNSFVTRGHSITLYSFDNIDNVPDGVVLEDAAGIVSSDGLDNFFYRGKPNVAHFSDYFRYVMFRKTAHIWIDTDMLLFRPIDLPFGRTVVARERANSINNAIMRLDSDRPELDKMITATEALMGHDIGWGDTGPRLMTRIFGQEQLGDVLATNLFFPIPHDDFWKPLLPEYREECEALCADSYTLHLWNNLLDGLALWKDLAPPAGSFLAECFARDGSLRFFADSYPEKVMKQMVENWRMRKDGADLGIAGLSRQLVPSILRTARHHAGHPYLRFFSSPARRLVPVSKPSFHS